MAHFSFLMKALSFRLIGLPLRHVTQPIPPVVLTTIRHRSWTSSNQRSATGSRRQAQDFHSSPKKEPWPERLQPLPVNELAEFLALRGQQWSRSGTVHSRLIRFGIPSREIQPALTQFVRAMRKDDVFRLLEYDQDMLDRLCHDLANPRQAGPVDTILTRLFYEWASHPKTQPVLEQLISSNTIRGIRELFNSANLSNLPAQFPLTRTHPPRTIVMHVGPTNSGKTHNALRALAAAKRGFYAGPLRLLAHEIFMRLNNGQIVPLGVDPEPAEPDHTTNIEGTDEEGRAVVRKDSDRRFIRPCNLITGEDRISVEAESPLLSCTVEMVPLAEDFDVAVVDEIQMLADPERGGAWTNAVLGSNVKELHLCGEEAAVPLVQALLRTTGDKIIVNRYNRLTPLVVAKQSLDGQLSKIRKGDCVVAFSRTMIFSMKAKIELQTGLKCAVVYGGLPSELRNDQAKLFNDPTSGYDVLVGSDAIGMGLNLYVLIQFLTFLVSHALIAR